MNYLHEFKRIRQELTDRKELLSRELSQLPEGVFYSYMSHGVKCYSERIPAVGNAKKEKKPCVTRDKDHLCTNWFVSNMWSRL